MRRWFGRVPLAIAMVLAVTQSIGVPPAVAAHSPCGVNDHFFDGYDTTFGGPQVVQGAWANIVVRPAALCPTDSSVNNFSMAWSMVSGNPGGYAQTGYVAFPGAGLASFAEDNQTGVSGLQTRTMAGAVSPGQVHLYWQRFNPTSACIEEYVDFVMVQCSAFNPFATWTQPFVGEFQGETTYVENDMPGSNAAGWATFSQAQIMDMTGTWVAPTLFSGINPLHTCSCYHQDAAVNHGPPTGVAFDIWTDPVAR